MNQEEENLMRARNTVGLMRFGTLSDEEAVQGLSELPPGLLAKLLMECVSISSRARSLFCDEDGFVDGEVPSA